MSYWRFAAMIATSTVVMYGLMYLNTFAFEHIFYSQTRLWMALLMGATMAVIMLGFMLSMYTNRTVNIAIFAGAIVVFGLSLWLVRSQVSVADRDYMSAMIPHHSIAIMTSKRAQISDPRVRKLADEIIAAQEREISEMKALIANPGGPAHAPSDSASPAEIVPAEEIVANAHIPTLDPAKLTPHEIETALGDAPLCTFRYTSESEPVLAIAAPAAEGARAGVVKLAGRLVVLELQRTDTGLELSAGDIRMTVADGGEGESGSEIAATFEIGSALSAEYRGYYGC